MTLNEYQIEAMKFANYDLRILYPVIGLAGETGEVAEKIKKWMRTKRKHLNEDERNEIAKELGDVLWYITALSNDLNLTLDFIACTNLNKLTDRKKRGKIYGEGDNR